MYQPTQDEIDILEDPVKIAQMISNRPTQFKNLIIKVLGVENAYIYIQKLLSEINEILSRPNSP